MATIGVGALWLCGGLPRTAACIFAIAFSSSCPSAIGTQQYHPGYSAAHVTRLHRWDHSGYDSMLEAEARWSERVASSMAAEVSEHGTLRKRRLRNGTAVAEREVQRTASQTVHHRRWLRISPVQAEGLLQHQEVSRASHRNNQLHADSTWRRTRIKDGAITSGLEAKARSELNQTSDFLRAGTTAKVEYIVNDERSAGSGGSLQGVRKHRIRKHSSPLNSGMAVTGLTSLSSQYVGPIGVGTIVSPDTCDLHNGDNLEFLEATAEERRKAKCHLENESQVWVVFDTGSTNIWVASDLCMHGACVKKGRHRYNHTRSNTYDWPVGGLELTVQFGTGCIKGPQALDDFHIGPFTVFNQTFGMIETQDGNVFNEVPFEGILGLAFSSMAANGVTPFFDSIIQQKALVHNEFAFYFSLDSVTANAVFWGGVDPSFYEGQIEYYPVVDPYYWALELLSFHIGKHEFKPDGSGTDDGSSVDGEEGDDWLYNDERAGLLEEDLSTSARTDRVTSWKALVDTGTTFFTAEGDMYNEIMAMLPPIKCSEMTSDSHPPITYRLRNINGEPRDFVLHNHQYMTSGSSDADAFCTAAFMRIDIPPKHGPALVLGETFLRHYYSVFDRADGNDKNARVGFAKSRHDSHPIDQLAQLTHGQLHFSNPEDVK